MCPYRTISDQALGRVGGKGERKTDTGYLKENPNSKFPREIRQCLDMILHGTLRMTRINAPVTTSSIAFLRRIRRTKIKPLITPKSQLYSKDP
jgi:hypothetical protein